MKVVVFSGGGGGARFVRGVHDLVGSGQLTVVANVGDDLEFLGVHVSPDLDSLLYILAGLLDEDRRWGRAGETWNALAAAAQWGGEDWFRLGDLDLGLHLVRSRALRSGRMLSDITAELARRAGVDARLLPATDDRLRTQVVTDAGRFPFQEWFVGRRHEDEVSAVEYDGAEAARAAPGVVEAIEAADALLFAPSNPFLSLGPILAVREIRQALEARRARCVAVSPLIGGAAVTGPLARMLSRMSGGTTPRHVTACYGGLIDALVVDEADVSAAPAPGSADPGVPLVVASILMHDRAAERRVAEVALEAACA